MKTKLHTLPKLSAPAHRALASVGISSLEDLSKLTEKEFMQLHGIGKNALIAIKAAMAECQLSFHK